jgi:hemoglobin
VSTVPPIALLPPLPSDAELYAIARVFYDKVYAHPWIGRFFHGVDQARQEQKLVRFFHLSWHDPRDAPLQGKYLEQEHAHLHITPALFELRQALFAEAVRERGHDEALVQAFLAFNDMWRPYVVKASIDECSAAYAGHIVDVPPPG